MQYCNQLFGGMGGRDKAERIKLKMEEIEEPLKKLPGNFNTVEDGGRSTEKFSDNIGRTLK